MPSHYTTTAGTQLSPAPPSADIAGPKQAELERKNRIKAQQEILNLQQKKIAVEKQAIDVDEAATQPGADVTVRAQMDPAESQGPAQYAGMSSQEIMMEMLRQQNQPNPAEQAIQEKMVQAYEDQQKRQREIITGAQERYEELLNKPVPKDLSGLLGAIDSITGSQLSRNYKAPETAQERAKQITDMEKYILQQERSFSNTEMQRLQTMLKAQKSDQNVEQLDMLYQNALAQEKLAAQRGQKTVRAQEKGRAESYKRERDMERNLQQYGKKVGDIAPAVLDSLQKMDTAIGGIDNVNNPADIPGIGPAMTYVPDILLTDEGSSIRQYGIDLVTNMIYMKTGKQINETEAARILRGLGMGADAKVSTFRKGVRNLKDQLLKIMENKRASFTPEVQQEWRDRGGVSAADFAAIGSGLVRPEQVERADWSAATQEEKQALVNHFQAAP